MTVAAWYMQMLLAFVFGTRAIACPLDWYVDGAFADSTFACAEPAPAGVCDSTRGCDDFSPTVQIVGLLACRRGERALTNWGGHGVHCGRSVQS